MQRNSLNYEQGALLILELPFTNLIGRKLRPVLLISSKILNYYSRDIIVAKISSKSKLPKFEVKISNKDLKVKNLKKESFIHLHSIFIVEKSLILKQIYVLSNEKLEEVYSVLNKIFDYKKNY